MSSRELLLILPPVSQEPDGFCGLSIVNCILHSQVLSLPVNFRDVNFVTSGSADAEAASGKPAHERFANYDFSGLTMGVQKNKLVGCIGMIHRKAIGGWLRCPMHHAQCLKPEVCFE